MSRRELSDEQRTVLEALVERPDSLLREIHQELVENGETHFAYSPDYGEGYNEERRTVRSRLRELQADGLADVDGRGKPWYPTTAGEEVVNET